MEKILTINNSKYVFQFIGILYIVYFISWFTPIERFGIIPRTQRGVIGIFTSPFLHANLRHIISNTIPLTVMLLVLVNFYPKKALSVILISILIGGLLVWIFGRTANHIGASGLIYGLAGFLIVNGFVEQKFIPLLISIAIIILYGSLIWGVLPSLRSYISWEGHLFGAIAGILAAFILKK